MRNSQNLLALILSCLLVSPPGQTEEMLVGADLKDRADAILTLMGYSLTPDVTTGSISVSNDPTNNPNIALSTLGGGFTWSQSLPLYLEGAAGYARYNPTFQVADSTGQESVSAKWNSLTLTGGIGWDFPVITDLVFRPVLNFSYGNVTSDSSIAGAILDGQSDADFEFLDSGNLDVVGLGGSLMFDYAHEHLQNEIDAKVRYTNIQLKTVSNAPASLEGTSDAQTLSLWSRWRAPTGIQLMKKPFRYVVEAAHTTFLGDLRGALGFNALNSIGAGVELDSSGYTKVISRTRLIFRYLFGENVEGTSVGLAVSF